MFILIAFAFIAGIVTVLSPCILPLLPIILASTDDSGLQRPLGVITGFIGSFTFFTLFLSTLVSYSGIPANSLRLLSIVILFVFGLTQLVPAVQSSIERLFNHLSRFAPQGQKQRGFWGGVVLGSSLGLLWTPCVGPILASVISLSLTGTVTTQALFITLAYALGTAIPLFSIMLAGSRALQNVPWLVRNTINIQKIFGVLMILTAIGIYFKIDRQFQTYILEQFPSYGTGLTQIEDNKQVQNELEKINDQLLQQVVKGKPMSDVIEKTGPQAPEIKPGGEWFNTEPLSLQNLQGKVVLVDFWTYSCINCQRTFPYLRNWWGKYEDQGLVIIGVHSPEFEFEKDPKNVADALESFNIEYPVVQDNNFATWRAYGNRYWPAKYLVDKNGRIRYTHFGEGDYDETEAAIQELLAETGANVKDQQIDNPTYQINSRTPELYLGYARISQLVSPQNIKRDAVTTFTKPDQLPANSFAYDGDWLVAPEYAAASAGAKLDLNFNAQQVFLVARPREQQPGNMEIYLDGKLINSIKVDKDQLYQLVNLDAPGQHRLRIEFPQGNIEIYAFTFG